MATPTLRAIRGAMPGAFIGGLCRPGIDELLAGSGFLDEVHVASGAGVMGPKHAAGKIRPRRYDTALLLTNSFSTALMVRIAGIPRRIGYDRDARGLLLTDRLEPPRRLDGSWAPIPAVDYYWQLASRHLPGVARPDRGPLELGVTAEQARAGADLLARAGVQPGTPYAVLNPGGNNPAKRWPPDRYAQVADWLEARGVRVLVNGSPGEVAVSRAVAGACRQRPPALLAELGVCIGSLKAAVRGARVMVTNDTGPRHIAAAFGVPLVSLFGPTDHRWTTIPLRPGAPEELLLADPTLPEGELANDHPDRCRIDRIEVERVLSASERALGEAAHKP
jgi:heptosyltransferase II